MRISKTFYEPPHKKQVNSPCIKPILTCNWWRSKEGTSYSIILFNYIILTLIFLKVQKNQRGQLVIFYKMLYIPSSLRFLKVWKYKDDPVSQFFKHILKFWKWVVQMFLLSPGKEKVFSHCVCFSLWVNHYFLSIDESFYLLKFLTHKWLHFFESH